jgi:hypothetical protein
MNSQVIAIDLASVFLNLELGRNTNGIRVPGLITFIAREQKRGSAIFFVCPQAHDPFHRQHIERFLENSGINAVFVTHGLPEGYDVFISRKAHKFDGTNFPE